MKLPISLAPRTLVAILRTSVYGCLAAFLSVSNAEAKSVVDAIVVGGVMADLVSWLVISIIVLPGNLLHGCYEGCLNLFFVLFLLHFGWIGGPVELAGQEMAAAFLSFMLVLGIKGAWYGAVYLTGIYEA